jgi:HK97 gp10 family phage protein
MSDGSVTDTGLDDLRKAVDALPRSVTLALRGVAWQSSRRIKDRAQQILASKTHGTGKTAASIEIIEDDANKQFQVFPAGNPDRPANLPLWLEFGTRYMAARPFMRPAADEENPRYQREMLQAASDVADQVLK